MAEPLVTFCMPLKNRPGRARASVQSLCDATDPELFVLSICEDIGAEKMDLSDMQQEHSIEHWWVDTGQTWNRSLLLNFSFKRARTPFLATWDADFLFPKNFGERLVKEIDSTDWLSEYIRIGVTETGRSEFPDGNAVGKGQIWGGLYVYLASKVAAIRGYDERFQNHGHEERDFNDRYRAANEAAEKHIAHHGYVWHESHDSGMRAKYNFANRRLRRVNKLCRTTVVNESGWGEAKITREWRSK